MDEKFILVKNWLTKASHDLVVSQKLGKGESEYFDVAIYHCQQAAEKAVKGFLVLHDIEFPKTHDIRLLVQMAKSITPEFFEFEDIADDLTPYATAFRYPGENMEPEPDEMTLALKQAEEIVNFIVSLLPDKIQNGLNERKR